MTLFHCRILLLIVLITIVIIIQAIFARKKNRPVGKDNQEQVLIHKGINPVFLSELRKALLKWNMEEVHSLHDATIVIKPVNIEGKGVGIGIYLATDPLILQTSVTRIKEIPNINKVIASIKNAPRSFR